MLRRIIDRPVAVTMIMLAAVVLGLVSTRLLPVSLIPDVDIPYITVQASADNMSARELDESVVKTLRQQLIQIEGLEEIVTESRDGGASIRMTFAHGSDINYAYIEVNEKIDRSLSFLPDIARPKVMKSGASDIPAFYLNMTLAEGSAGDFTSMGRFAQEVVAKRIEQLEEVAMVDISGHTSEEILIVPDKSRLAQMGMSMEDFERVIRSSDISLGSLSIRDGQYRYNVKFLSDAGSEEDIENIWFKHQDRLMQVKDVAQVSVKPSKMTHLVRSDGKRAVCLAVIKQSDARMSSLKKSIAGLMDVFSKDYPEVCFEITRDQTALLQYSINNLIRNILAGVLFACIVIFLFMKDFRSPALVSLTIPVALVISMVFFRILGISVNIISLSGLLLGVGMMVDNTIILVDNITDRWNRGEPLRKAVLEGTGEVTGPMLSSVLTTCAVFIPLVFASGIAGSLFYDQAMAITVVLLTSYLVTVTVIPVYYLWWYRGMDSFRPSRLLDRISLDRHLFAAEGKLMEWFLGHKAVSWAVLGVSFIGIAVCVKLMPKEKLPEMTYTDAVMTVDWNSQVSVEENERRVAEIEREACEGASQVTSLVGPQKFILSHSGDLTSSEASVYMQFGDTESLEKAKDNAASLIGGRYPEASVRFETSGNIFDMVFGEKVMPLTARLRPVSRPELETPLLRETVEELRQALPGVEIPDIAVKTDMVFVADPEMLALYDVSYRQLSDALKNALNENTLFTIVQGTRSLPVVTGDNRGSLEEVLSETVIEQKERNIPVMALMRQTYAEDLKSIVSGPEGVYYPVSMDIGADKVPGAIGTVDAVLREKGDFEADYSGSYFTNRKMVREMALILLVALLLLFLILASQFESLVQPLIILAEVVVDIFFSLLVLWCLGISINLMSLIGLVVICGIVINDSILKIDTINRLRRSGMELRQSIMTAGRRRLKAIIMTSLTTVLSVLPFLSRGNMGDDLQYPLSVVIIAGMTVGTLVSLFVLPTLYYCIYRNGKVK